MSRFLLVHGSAHGAWCWDHLIPHLHAAGHQACAIDLPSHGQDPTPAAAVTLEVYADAIAAALEDKTVIVAHSMAGFPATYAADKVPHLVDRLIYLCAHVPEPGKSMADMRALADYQPLAEVMIPSEDGVTVTFDAGLARAKFYHDVDPALSDWAIGKLCPQPVLPQQTPYPTTPVPEHRRHYIRCMDDKAILPSYQVARTRDWPDGTVTEMPTSHSPFLSDPAGLARHLTAITES